MECKGIALRDGDRVVFTDSSKPVNGSDMDIDLPGYAWDLLHIEKNLSTFIAHLCGTPTYRGR